MTFVCTHCGSTEVFADAWAALNSDEVRTFDACHCDQCGGECLVQEVAGLDVARTTPVTAQDIAVHASSLWDGFAHSRDSDDLFRIWGAGGIELHFQMAELAETDARLCHALFLASTSGFPGVYTYEVTEALGDAVAVHLQNLGQFPEKEAW